MGTLIARNLDAPFDILLIAKLTSPQPPHQIVGAVDEHGRISLIHGAARWHHLTTRTLVAPAREAFADLEKRRARYRAVMPEADVRGRTVIVVDHGIETGATMLAAVASLKDRAAAKVVAAAPAGGGKATWQLHDAADAVVIPHTPSKFKGVKHFYEDFSEVPDHEVEQALQEWASAHPELRAGVQTLTMRLVGAEGHVLYCEMDLPPGTTRGSGPFPAVIFAHGRESDARSPRILPISRRLAKRGFIGVRVDFTGHGRSEGTIEDATEDRMLADLQTAFDNLCILQEVNKDSIGLVGSGSGGMLALRFGAEHSAVKAIVIRGPVSGREVEATERIKAPTLLIHAERDPRLGANAEVHDRELPSAHQLLEIPESERLFNDPISRELMVSATVDWLGDHL
jgi:putative phosphoribosyl transferase